MKRYLKYWMLAAPLLAYAQLAEVEVGAPTLGYALNETSRDLYPIQGVPGAAVLGGRLNLARPVDRIWLSPSRRHALAASEASMIVVKLDGGTGVARTLPGSRPENAGFSPDGRSAAILRNGSVELWQGFPDQPELIAAWPAPGGVNRLAASDDGARVVALSDGRLFLMESQTRAISEEAGFVDICFLGNSQTLLAADGMGNRVVQWSKVGENGSYSVVAAEAEGVSRPVAMTLAADESLLAILSSDRMVLFNRSSGKAESVGVGDLKPEGVSRASGNAVFQMHRSGAGASWLVDADSTTPRLFSVAGREKE